MNFTCVDDLSIYTDSLLFEKGHTIATLTDEEHGVTIDLKVQGDVNILYKGINYRHVDEFPDELIELIKAPNYIWYTNSDVYVFFNNWFEYIYQYNGVCDGILFESDLCDYSVDELKDEMINEILPWVMEN